MPIIDNDILFSSTKHGRHLASCLEFPVLYDGLNKEIELGNIIKNTDPSGNLEIFNYSIQCTFDNNWNEYSLIARGLILEPNKQRVVALTLPKFYNFGEVSYAIPDLPFTVTNKYDGSLGIIYFHNNSWHVATRGSFTSVQSRWAEDWLNKNVNTVFLNPNYTYLVEIIYNDNKIVVNYDFEGLVILTVYDLVSGHELPYIALQSIAEKLNLKLTQQFEYDSIDKMLEVAEQMSHNTEGFVVRFENGYRLKIKGEAYCRIHRLISNVKPNYLWECMVNGDNLDNFRQELPEELRRDFDNITDILQKKFDDIIEKIKIQHEQTKHLSDKELGLYLKSRKGDMEEVIRNTVFLVRKKNLLTEAYVGGSQMRKTVFKMFQPKGNVLEGFVPSIAMNRFE